MTCYSQRVEENWLQHTSEVADLQGRNCCSAPCTERCSPQQNSVDRPGPAELHAVSEADGLNLKGLPKALIPHFHPKVKMPHFVTTKMSDVVRRRGKMLYEVAPSKPGSGSDQPSAGPTYRANYAQNGFPTLEGVNSLYEVFQKSVQECATKECLGHRVDKNYIWQTYQVGTVPRLGQKSFPVF